MTDLEIGLLTDEDEEPAHRRRRRPPGLALLLALTLVALVAGGGLAGVRALVHRLEPVAGDYAGPGSGVVVVQVDAGDSAGAIGATLAKAGVVRSAAAFRRAAAQDDRSRTIQPGFYRLKKRMRAAAALALMLDPTALVRTRVVIPEGTTAAATLALLARSTEIPAADLVQTGRAGTGLGLPAYARNRPEGFLFPATYQFGPGTSAAAALRQLVDRFRQAAREVRLDADAAALHKTPYQALIVASIVEAEVKLPSDYPRVARVIYNRLARGMPLQMDSTVNYVLPVRKSHLSVTDLANGSPYNTYRHGGLPPTPINSPGEQALRAALHPSPGPWIYFVTIDKAAHNAFTDSYPVFVRLKAQGAKARGR